LRLLKRAVSGIDLHHRVSVETRPDSNGASLRLCLPVLNKAIQHAQAHDYDA